MENAAQIKLSRLRTRRRRTWWILAILFPAFLCAITLLDFIRLLNGGVFVALSIAVGISAIVTWILHCFSRCPRCDQYFYAMTVGSIPILCNPFARRCRNCGLRLFCQWFGTPEQCDALVHWIAHRESGEPVPDVGLLCPSCAYPWTGLTSRTCPECGRAIDVSLFGM